MTPLLNRLMVGLVLLLAWPLQAAPLTRDQVQQLLTLSPARQARFEQEKQVAGLSQPLKASGELLLVRDLGLWWQQQKPFALTLTLMVLPLITRNTQEALKTVPATYRSGALGIGATKWYMIRTILLPSAMPGIITGIILAIGRIVGESAALLFTAGSGYLLPKTFAGFFKKIFESGGTLTIQLYLSMSKAQYDAAFGIAAVLLIIVLFINLLTKILAKKFDVSKLD